MPEHKTHWKKVVSDPNFIGEGDFEPGEEKILTIAKVVAEEMVQTAEGKSKKAVLYWKEPNNKPMILNVAKSKSISKVAGSGYFEDWIGHRVQLYIDPAVKAFGEIVSAVRVRPYKPKEAATIKCKRCGKPISPANGMSAEQLAKYTEKKYGAALCAECATKAAQEKVSEPKPEEPTQEATSDADAG